MRLPLKSQKIMDLYVFGDYLLFCPIILSKSAIMHQLFGDFLLTTLRKQLKNHKISRHLAVLWRLSMNESPCIIEKSPK